MSRASILKVTVDFIDGTSESWQAGLHIDAETNMLILWPEGKRANVRIPLTSIKKIHVDS